MAASNVFNSVYEEVRKIGLPYQIKESGGSVLIKISSDIKHQYNQERGKFRFNTVRTFGGSENKNWRSPISYDDNSVRIFSRINFPDITFLKYSTTTEASTIANYSNTCKTFATT